MDDALRKLIEEFKAKAAEARAHARKLGYKHTSVKASYNIEAGVYDKCAQRLQEEHERLQRK